MKTSRFLKGDASCSWSGSTTPWIVAGVWNLVQWVQLPLVFVFVTVIKPTGYARMMLKYWWTEDHVTEKRHENSWKLFWSSWLRLHLLGFVFFLLHVGDFWSMVSSKGHLPCMGIMRALWACPFEDMVMSRPSWDVVDPGLERLGTLCLQCLSTWQIMITWGLGSSWILGCSWHANPRYSKCLRYSLSIYLSIYLSISVCLSIYLSLSLLYLFCVRMRCIRIWRARTQCALHIFNYTKHIVL